MRQDKRNRVRCAVSCSFSKVSRTIEYGDWIARPRKGAKERRGSESRQLIAVHIRNGADCVITFYTDIRKMLELVERKASGISWPMCRTENLDNLEKNPKGSFVLRRRTKKDCAREKRWRRDSKGLLCSLGQLGCSDSYSPDTLGTWKFHKVSRTR